MHEDFSKPRETETLNNSQGLGTIAIMLSLVAFMLSVSSPWVMEQYAPEPPKLAIEIVTPNQFDSLTGEIMTWIFGMPPTAPEEKAMEQKEAPKNTKSEDPEEGVATKHWTDHWAITVTVLAMFSIFFAVIALLQRESKAIAFTAMFFATGAIVAQHIMVAIIVGIIFVLIIGLLSAMGVSFGG